MLASLLLALSCALATLGSPLETRNTGGCADGKDPWKGVEHDVLVLGGGPAGLQTTMSLARLGRKVLLVDNKKYRNAATEAMHDVPGLDGTPPPKFRAMARADLAAYPTITYSDATITSFENIGNSTYFKAHGSKGETFTARKIVLASGVMDELPKTKGIDKVWGTGAYWCPWCDGWEHRNGEWAVLTIADLDDAIFAHALTTKTTILLDGQAFDKKALEKQWWKGIFDSAAGLGIQYDNRTVTEVGFVDPLDRSHSHVRVTFADKKTRDYKGLLIATTRRVHSKEAIATLGVKFTDNGLLIATTQIEGYTSVFGVFAAGDVMQKNQNVANALRAGKLTGMRVVEMLAIEESLAAAGWDWRNTGRKCTA